MGGISEQEAAMLVTLIYRPKIKTEWVALGEKNQTVGKLIENIEYNMEYESADASYGAEMNKAENMQCSVFRGKGKL